MNQQTNTADGSVASSLLSCPFCGSQPDGVVDTVTGELEIACTNPCCWAKPKVIDKVGVADRLWNARNDETQLLRDIARGANMLTGGMCCERHEAETQHAMSRALRRFKDDSFTQLREPF